MGKEQTARVRRAVARAVAESVAAALASTVLAFPFLIGLASAIASGSPGYVAFVAYGGGTAFIAALAVRAAVRAVRRAAERIQTVYGRVSPEDLAELTESRREIVAAFEIERRRIERDLHDGAQQYLVTASIDVGEADLLLDSAIADGAVVPEKMGEVRALLGKAQDDAESALRALRSTVAGIHPKVLSDLGLEAAVRSQAASSPLKVEVFVPNRLPAIPEGVIAAAYFLVSEGLTNVAKYAPAARVSVLLAADADLHVSVSDDGPGGASVQPDRGLSGMRERLAAFGGVLEVVSPLGGPTTLTGRIPLLLRQGEFGVSPANSRASASETDGEADVGGTGDDARGSVQAETRGADEAAWRSPGGKTREGL